MSTDSAAVPAMSLPSMKFRSLRSGWRPLTRHQLLSAVPI
jgi:hypothetical protein